MGRFDDLQVVGSERGGLDEGRESDDTLPRSSVPPMAARSAALVERGQHSRASGGQYSAGS